MTYTVVFGYGVVLAVWLLALAMGFFGVYEVVRSIRAIWRHEP